MAAVPKTEREREEGRKREIAYLLLAPKCVSGFSINFFLRVSFLIDRSLRRRRRRRRRGKEEREH